MPNRSDCVVFLKGNMSEGFHAYGPYVDYDEAGNDNDAEGWMTGMTYPGRPVRIAKRNRIDGERHLIGYVYVPAGIPDNDVGEWVSEQWEAFSKVNPEPESDSDFIIWLCNSEGLCAFPTPTEITL